MSYLSHCNSRNLNLNPFCDLSKTTLAMWQPDVKATYGNGSEAISYIKGVEGPMRLKYPYDMAEKELITSLAEVCSVCDDIGIILSPGISILQCL